MARVHFSSKFKQGEYFINCIEGEQSNADGDDDAIANNKLTEDTDESGDVDYVYFGSLGNAGGQESRWCMPKKEAEEAIYNEIPRLTAAIINSSRDADIIIGASPWSGIVQGIKLDSAFEKMPLARKVTASIGTRITDIDLNQVSVSTRDVLPANENLSSPTSASKRSLNNNDNRALLCLVLVIISIRSSRSTRLVSADCVYYTLKKNNPSAKNSYRENDSNDFIRPDAIRVMTSKEIHDRYHIQEKDRKQLERLNKEIKNTALPPRVIYDHILNSRKRALRLSSCREGGKTHNN